MHIRPRRRVARCAGIRFGPGKKPSFLQPANHRADIRQDSVGRKPKPLYEGKRDLVLSETGVQQIPDDFASRIEHRQLVDVRPT
jgi:hypothetical protein